MVTEFSGLPQREPLFLRLACWSVFSRITTFTPRALRFSRWALAE